MSIPSRSSILNTIPGLIAEHFNLDAVPPLDAPLYDQMHFDSLQMIELVSLVEELAGLAPGESPAEYPILVTLNDCTDYFVELTEPESEQ